MIRIFSAPTSVPVDALRTEFESEGIQCLVRNRDLSMTIGEVPPIETWPSLWVLDERQVEAAQAIVDRFLADTGEPAPTWRCPRCGEDIDGRFSACWRCDTATHESGLAEPTAAAVRRDYALLGDRAVPVLRWLVRIGALAAVLYAFLVLTGAHAGPAGPSRPG
jgi:hypothetical protein